MPSTATASDALRSPRRDLAAILVGSACQDLALRVAQIALPLVVLSETGSIAATGLVAGASGLPVVVSPWWAKRARHRVSSGPALTVLALVEAVAISIVPTAAALGRLDVGVLVLAGLLLGVGEALSQPGRAALLADVGDRWRQDGAVQALTWQDLLRRVGMVVGPVVGAMAVGAGLAHELLWTQAASVALSGLLAWPVRGDETGRLFETKDGSRIRDALVGRSDVRAGWWVRGTSCLLWFPFALGLPVLGTQQGRPEVLVGWGMTGYGIGAVAGTVVATRLVATTSVRRLVQVSWSISGLAWVVIAAWPGPAGALVGGGLAGGFVVVGIAAVNASITRSSTGSERRTLLSGQAVVVNTTSSAGMLVGGLVLAAAGVRTTLAATGLLVVVVTLVATTRMGASTRRPTRTVSDAAPSAASERPRDGDLSPNL